MKRISFFSFFAVLLLSACNNKNSNYDATGVFETTEIVVSAKGNGEILQFDIEEGQKVAIQQVVGLIDTTQLYLKKVQLQANVRAINSRQVNVASQIAVIRQQLETAKSERQRFAKLVSENAANQKQLDDINAQIATLEKQLAAQTETLGNTNSSLTYERQAVVSQIAQIDDQINNSVIKSPVAGTVLEKFAEAGELATAGKPLFKVANLEKMYLRAYITASQLTELKIGQQVKVFSDLGEKDSKEYAGTVSWISDKAEFTPKTIQTRDVRANLVYAVKISVKDEGYIKKGMYGEILFEN